MGNLAYSSHERGDGTRVDYAAKLCQELSFNGFDDWFLPSRDELLLMNNLTRNGLGDFDSDYYWTSTADGDKWAMIVSLLYSGSVGSDYRARPHNVRPIRAF